MKKKQVLIDALKSGKIVKVIYTAGSQPNHAREIIPLKIVNDHVYAKCLNSSSEKSFHINKLKILSDRQYNVHDKWNPNFVSINEYENFVLKREKRNKIFRYFSIFLVFIAVVFFYFKFLT